MQVKGKEVSKNNCSNFSLVINSQSKKDYFIYENLYTNFIVITKHKSRAKTQNIKKKKN